MRFAQLAIVVGLFSINSVQAEDEKKTTGDPKPQVKNAVSDEPMSIFNEEIRCFKFKIDHATITIEQAYAFNERYNVKGNPPIIGAFPDVATNSLCVIAPPEAETAIRKSLATWIIDLQGLPGSPLVFEKRTLKAEREGLLTDLAHLELALVESPDDKNKQTEIQARMDAFEAELAVIERQIQVVEKYLKRIEDGGN